MGGTYLTQGQTHAPGAGRATNINSLGSNSTGVGWSAGDTGARQSRWGTTPDELGISPSGLAPGVRNRETSGQLWDASYGADVPHPPMPTRPGVTGGSGTPGTFQQWTRETGWGPKMHTGGIVGMEPYHFARGGEVPITAKRGEGVFTAGQMAALGRGGKDANVNVTINNYGKGGSDQQDSGPTSQDVKQLKQMIVGVVAEWNADQERFRGTRYRSQTGARR